MTHFTKRVHMFYFGIITIRINFVEYSVYEGCSIYNETVLITFTFYEIQRHKYYKH